MCAPEIDSKLADTLLTLIQAQPQGLSEHSLMKQLSANGYPHFTPSLDPLAMFQSHFLLFHLLYRLADDWRQQGHGELHIHCLRIALQSEQPRSAGLIHDDPIKRYYLDYQHYISTQTEEVVALLNQFWQGFSAQADERALQTAKHTLELDPHTPHTLADINRQYRLLSQRHHPDRGGDTAHFQKINQSAQILRQHYKK
jgi:hypothetical protein